MTGKYLIYDCEIIKCIPSKTVNLSESFEMCSGWSDHENMGISVVGFGSSDGFNFHWDSRKNSLLDLGVIFRSAVENQKKIIGFNSRNFDDNLLKANGIEVETDYDLLEEVRFVAYGSRRWEDNPKGFSYSLDAIAKANGEAKTGSGAIAPQLWQQGKHQEVIDYCLHDVEITRKMLEFGLQGRLSDPNTGELLRIRAL